MVTSQHADRAADCDRSKGSYRSQVAGVCVKYSTTWWQVERRFFSVSFFFPFSILGRNILGKLDRNAFYFPNYS